MVKTRDHNRIVFTALLALSFLTILVANMLTPYLSDDFSYGAQVRTASSLWELFSQEAEQYMTWNGRSVVHLLLRFSLYLPGILFKLANSACFVLLSVLIYLNVEGRRRWDTGLLILITLMLWGGSVTISETVLWQTGACNYLWGTTIIMGFVTCYRYCLRRAWTDSSAMTRSAIPAALCFFLLGVAAGWCNENTSGGGLILSLIFLISTIRAGTTKDTSHKLPLWAIAGPAGQLTGLIIMVLSPGSRARASLQEPEAFSGLVGIIARFQKITVTVHGLFFIWIAVFLMLFILVSQAYIADEGWRGLLLGRLLVPVSYALAAVATSYALVLTAPTQPRAHFGAGIFWFTAIAALYTGLPEKSYLIRSFKRAAVYIGMVWFFFFYMDEVTDLGRIYRECSERTAIVEEAARAGAPEVYVASLRPGFETVLSDAYHVDLSDDAAYWTNVAMEQYYGVDSIIALPREEWEAMGH